MSTCLNRCFSDETVKNFSRVSCRFGQSTDICLTVSGSLQDLQTGWSSPDIKYEWVRLQWPSQSLLIHEFTKLSSVCSQMCVSWCVNTRTVEFVEEQKPVASIKKWKTRLQHVQWCWSNPNEVWSRTQEPGTDVDAEYVTNHNEDCGLLLRFQDGVLFLGLMTAITVLDELNTALQARDATVSGMLKAVTNAWNSLPARIRSTNSHDSFCRQLKTYLFYLPV